MNNDFNVDNAVAVAGNSEIPGGSFSIEHSSPVQSNKSGTTSYDDFKGASSALTKDNAPQTPLRANKGQSKDTFKDVMDSEKSIASATPPLKDGEHSKSLEEVKQLSDFPDHSILNTLVTNPAILISNELEKNFVRPFTGKPAINDQESVDRLAAKHPIAQITSGFAPWIVSAPLFPAGLTQFVTLPVLSTIGKQRVENSLMNNYNVETRSNADNKKLAEIFKEGTIGAATGRVFEASSAINYVKRPFATVLAKAGVIAAGNTVMHTMYGDDLAQSFKDGALLGALAHIGELPHLGSTVLGRGIIAHANGIYADMAVKSGLPAMKMDPESPAFPEQVHTVTEGLAKQIKGVDQPRIISATVKLPDGTELHGASHEEALQKIGLSKGMIGFHGTDADFKDFDVSKSKDAGVWFTPRLGMAEAYKTDKGRVIESSVNLENPYVAKVGESRQEAIAKAMDKGHDGIIVKNDSGEVQSFMALDNKSIRQYTSGFTVLNPDGTTKFITREESKQEPFNLPTGHSEEVKGLNESKFMTPPEEPKITNPETIRQMNEKGGINVNLIPGVAEAAEVLQKSHAELTEKFTPYTVGKEGSFTAQVIREHLGVLARSQDRLDAALSQAKKLFDKADKDSSLDFIYRMEEGDKQATPELQKIADTLRSILDTKRNEVKALGTGKLENFIENYFPHVWESPDKAINTIKKMLGKRPLEGGKSFLKKRSIDSMRTGIEAGLTPVSYNPIDSVMLKVREMDKYLMAHRSMQALKAQGLMEYVPIGKKSKDGWIKINDAMSTVYKSPMIAVEEAYDEHVMDKLNNVAKSLGIDVERLIKLRGKSWGSSQRGFPLADQEGELVKGQADAGKIKTKFGGPESVLAHEIGHQIDEMYSGKERFIPEYSNMILDQKIKKLNNNETLSPDERKLQIDALKYQQERNNELKALADLRYEGARVPEYFKKYVRKSSEKMAVLMEAYIHAPNKFKEAAPKMFKVFDTFIKSKPELKPLSEIKPSLVVGTNKSEVYAGGLVVSGHYYAQPDSARILNNYLSPGLAGKSYIYDMYRTAGNTLNQFQLGISAFHLGFTSMDATISKFALGINKLSTGDYAGAIKEFGTAPFAPVTNIMQGRELLQAWYGKDMGPLTNMIADLMATGGGRAKMDKFYATGAKESMMKALKEGKILTGALKVPYYIVEQMARPIMEYIVPRQKMGVFMDIMKMELERNPNLSHQELRGVAQRAWDSVDNRMGQVVYDNLFWNKTVKDLGMASVRSLGWNLGTIREIGGGTKDVIGNVQDLIHGKGTKMSYRTAYVMALPIVTGIYGALYQYLHTGKGPQEMKDYFFPKNGAIDNKGQEARVSLPTYMKDIYHYTQNPVQTVINKFSPVNNAVLEMMLNRDFYGTQIRNVDDPMIQQVLDELQFVGGQFEPFGFRNLGKDTRTSAGSKIEPFIGVTPAPFDVNMTKAEREAYELEKGKIPVGSRTKEQAQHSQNKAKLRNDYMASHDMEPLKAAVDAGTISSKEKKEIIKDAGLSRLERVTKHLTFEEVNHLLKYATASERPELESILDKKRQGKTQRGTWTQAEEDLYDQSFNAKK